MIKKESMDQRSELTKGLDELIRIDLTPFSNFRHEQESF